MGRHPRIDPTDRELAMAEAYRGGKTLAEIGQTYGVTRQCVQQILKPRFNIGAKDGGEFLRARIRATKRAARRDEKTLRLKGCTFAQYAELRAMLKPTRAYSHQMKNAHARGISWEFNLWQWWTVWQESGRWDQRGRGQGYVMCRKGDIGPYSPDNVFIQRGTINSFEGSRKPSGLPIGVRVDKRCKNRPFVASRMIASKRLHLGYFATATAASAAYQSADPIGDAA